MSIYSDRLNEKLYTIFTFLILKKVNWPCIYKQYVIYIYVCVIYTIQLEELSSITEVLHFFPTETPEFEWKFLHNSLSAVVDDQVMVDARIIRTITIQGIH